MLQLINVITDRIFGIFIMAVGLVVLFRPYEKFKEAAPKLPSKTVFKVLGAILTIGGILFTLGII